ncbi:MAG: hypothetical protein LCH87_16080 [Actinobacteria bacterium]|nr:hypothetical protein [Actinomycetota bacterium]
MTASVADLLDRLHQQAWAISNLSHETSETRFFAHAKVWPRLALAAVRALNNIPAAGDYTDDQLMIITSILNPIARDEWRTPPANKVASRIPPDSRIYAMAKVLGGIADLLSMGLPGVESDPDTTRGLRANILAPIMVAANWSRATAPVVNDNVLAIRHLGQVAAISESYAVVAPEDRPGPFDDLAAVPVDENSLDAAIKGWSDAAAHALSMRNGLSGLSLQTVAADLSVLTGASAAATHAAIRTGDAHAGRGTDAMEVLTAANRLWREACAWPRTVYLGGVRDPELGRASLRLREVVVSTLRDGKAWADADLLAKRMPGVNPLAVARRAIQAAAQIADDHHSAMAYVFDGGRTLMTARSMNDVAYMNTDVFTARRRGGWIPMPRYESTGQELHSKANAAWDKTMQARNRLMDAARPAPRQQPPAELEQGRIVTPLRPTMPSSQRLTKEPPFGMGTGGPSSTAPGEAIGR